MKAGGQLISWDFLQKGSHCPIAIILLQSGLCFSISFMWSRKLPTFGSFPRASVLDWCVWEPQAVRLLGSSVQGCDVVRGQGDVLGHDVQCIADSSLLMWKVLERLASAAC